MTYSANYRAYDYNQENKAIRKTNTDVTKLVWKELWNTAVGVNEVSNVSHALYEAFVLTCTWPSEQSLHQNL